MVVGLATATLASLMFNVGAALQALSARTRPHAESMRAVLLWRLARQRPWLIGLVLSAVGFPLQLVALAHAPLVVVQPALSAGLLLLLALCVWPLRERVGARELTGVGAILLGLGLLVSAAPSDTGRLNGWVAPVIVLAILSAIALAPAWRSGRRGGGRVPAIWTSGVLFAAASLAAKAVSDDVAAGRLGRAAGWAFVAALTGIVATLAQMSSLQFAPAKRVFPITVAVNTALPLVLAPLFLEGHGQGAAWQRGWGLLGLLIVLAGLTTVAAAGSVSDLATGGAPVPAEL